MKIAAVVVTYNRLDLLKECIQSLRNQTRELDEIIVVNNSSTDGTEEWLLNQNDLTVITQPNLGGAGGFHTGIKAAYEKEYDWIWCMDDDSFADINSLKHLEQNINSKYIAIAGVVKDFDNKVLNIHRGYLRLNKLPKQNIQIPLIVHLDSQLVIDFASFVGILISSKVVSLVGLPKREFFISNDDVEYCIRMQKFGNILYVPESIIYHPKKQNGILKRKIGLKVYRIDNNYGYYNYLMRNYFWILKVYTPNLLDKFINMIFVLFREIFFIFLFDNQKFKRIRILVDCFGNALLDDFEKI